MTNTTYFYNTIRDDDSISTSSDDIPQTEQQEDEQVANLEPSHSLYLAIGKACLACARPPIELEHNTCSKQNTLLISPASGVHSKHLVHATPQGESAANLKIFDFEQLRMATRKFHHDGVLGEGGFGKVFKGWIDENTLTATNPGVGIPVAVRRLNLQGSECYKEWLTEIKYLGSLYHHNLVRLFGYCLHEEERLLVYEFMDQGSLDDHLFRKGSSCLLSWNLRMKIALQAAKALAFLHNDDRKIAHRYFKGSNILLDSNYNAKLNDFRFAEDSYTGESDTIVFSSMPAPFGYYAPEYLDRGLSETDVFNFGVVLLELLSGRRAFDKARATGKQRLVDWAKHCINKKRNLLPF